MRKSHIEDLGLSGFLCNFGRQNRAESKVCASCFGEHETSGIFSVAEKSGEFYGESIVVMETLYCMS